MIGKKMKIESEKTYQSVLGYLWKTNPVEFTYPKFLNSFRNVLLIMPRNQQFHNQLNRWREKIIFALGTKSITMLSIGTQIEYLREWSQKPMLFTDTDINFAGIVSSRIIKDIMKNKFKFAIDLSPDFDLITAQIALRAKIPTRIGLVSGQTVNIGRKYFNILVSGDFKDGYEQLTKLLSAKGR